MRMALVGLALVGLMGMGLTCQGDESKVEEIVSSIRSEVTMGTHRAEVERVLRRLNVEFVYVPKDLLQLINQATFEGHPLSGRFDVSTPFEGGALTKRQASIFIELDQEERVVNVRVEGFGLR